MLEKLKDNLQNLKKVAICYSGGIDSSFLLTYANIVLSKSNVLAVIVHGSMMKEKDYDTAIEYLKENDYSYIEIPYEPLLIEEFKYNRSDRCYYCKKKMMEMIKSKAKEFGFENILDGTNLDDTKTNRPGLKALSELGIYSILAECGFTKNDVRKNAKKIGIQFWNKPSNSCLATRVPYDTLLTEEKLKKIEKAENIINSIGINDVRVRNINNSAQIVVEEKYFDLIIKSLSEIKKIKELGFDDVSLLMS